MPTTSHDVLCADYLFGLPINSTESSPLLHTPLQATYKQLSILLALYSRCVVIRVDAHPIRDGEPLGHGENPSLLFSAFVKNTTAQIRRRFATQVAFQWVREVGTFDYNLGPHWHFWLGCKKDNSLQAITQAQELQHIFSDAWPRYFTGGRCHYAGWFYLERNKLCAEQRLKQQSEMIDALVAGKARCNLPLSGIRERHGNLRVVGGLIDECFFALSYLSKARSKQRLWPHEKLWNSSRLKVPPERIEHLHEVQTHLAHAMPCRVIH